MRATTIILLVGVVCALLYFEHARHRAQLDVRDTPASVGNTGSKAGVNDASLRARLTDEQYYVTQQGGTEPPFHNAFWDNHSPGIYVDVVSGEPLFSSQDKFDSGTGWPSFTKPLVADNIIERTETGPFDTHTEVKSHGSNSHLGDVFDDGPAPTHQRFCIDSAALRFIPATKLAVAGYGQFSAPFQQQK